jgi:hypothetical protein
MALTGHTERMKMRDRFFGACALTMDLLLRLDVREIDLAHERRAFVGLNAYGKLRHSREIDRLVGKPGVCGWIPRDERQRFGGGPIDGLSGALRKCSWRLLRVRQNRQSLVHQSKIRE